MKKTSAILLAVVLVIALAVVSVSAAPVTYNAVNDWDTAKADGSNVPWKYVFSSNGGSSFNVMQDYREEDWGNFWFFAQGEYVGIGFNHDVANKFEANVNDDNSVISGISFVAPEAGDYNIKAFKAIVSWGQSGDKFFIMQGSTKIYEAALGTATEDDDFVLNVPARTVTLAAGEEVTFYGMTAGGWLSLYIEGLEVAGPADEAAETTAPAETTAETPQTGDANNSSALIYFLISGIVILAAVLVLTRKTRHDQA